MCMAVGKVSLDDWLMLTSSFGWQRFSPASSFARFAMTSFAFMFDWVPEPVCHTTRGKCPSNVPAATSPAAVSMTESFSAVIVSGRSRWFARAAACFSTPKAWMISAGIVSIPTPMRKFIQLRWVCAPQ